jgi:DNA-binding transcriptional MerR regulator
MPSGENVSGNSEVNRPFAAEILNVSLRTLDRYAKRNMISSIRRGRELYFLEADLLDFKAKLLARQGFQEVKTQKKPRTESISSDFPEVTKAQAREQEQESTPDVMTVTEKKTADESPYKELYEKTDGELKMTREQLQVANYRIGSLEGQMKSMVPLIEYKKQRQEMLSLAEDNSVKQKNLVHLEQQVTMERFVKKIYMAFLLAMMIIVPLLAILQFVA